MTNQSVTRELTLSQLSPEKAELLALLLTNDSRRQNTVRVVSRNVVAGKFRIRTSWAQRRLWFIDSLEGGSPAYHISTAVTLQGPLRRDALKHALDAMIQRHEALRTTFVVIDGEPWQEISAGWSFELKVSDLSRHEDVERQARLTEIKIDEVLKKFDLREGPLIRGTLIRMSAESHVLLLTVHHIVSDGWSIGILLRELEIFYEAFSREREAVLEPLVVQYADYAEWQREYLSGDELDKQLTYWRDRLQGSETQLELPTDRPRPKAQSHRGGSIPVEFNASLSGRLRAFAHHRQMTVFMVLNAAWTILLSRLSGQSEVAIGTPIANRQRPEFEKIVGMFVNTLVLRSRVSHELQVDEFLRQVKQTTLGAYANQDLPFERLVEILNPKRSLSHNPIFQVMLVLQNTPKHELQLPELRATAKEVVDVPSMFDLLLSLEDGGEKISGHLFFAADIFERDTVARWTEYLRVLLSNICEGNARYIGDLSILSEQERYQVLHEFNDTKVSFDRGTVVHRLFEGQVRLTPDSTAAIFDNSVVTYSDLNRRATNFARLLKRRGVETGHVVGICTDRGIDMLVGMLAILKAGGAYLPLDPNLPKDRLRHMLTNASPQVLVAQEDLISLLPETRMIVSLTRSMAEPPAPGDENLSVDEAGPVASNLVYVIYTSGSTGSPKATAMSHRSMVNLIEWQRRELRSGAAHRVLQFAALSFDVAFQEIFSTLCTGGTLVLLHEQSRRDVGELVELLWRSNVDRLFLPPLMLQSLAEHVRVEGRAPASLLDIVVAGERLRVSPDVVQLFSLLPRCRLHNHYGPTETHVVTALTLPEAAGTWPVFPSIGRPIANSRIYILEDNGSPVPIGVAGEIWIGGVGVARGYLHRPEMTADRFRACPFAADGIERLYRTGDVGRWRVDGTIEYLGRNDHQVKLRGYRIELAEIELRLGRHEGVKDVAVTVREDRPGDRRLVAYFTSQLEGQPSPDELRAYLRGALPEYMIPSAFVRLASLPTTPSGKVDRRGLPSPELEAYVSGKFEPPAGDTEKVLASVWQEVLGVERVGRLDNFFELGGHSLLIVQMIERLRRAGFSTKVRKVYETSDLAGLACTLTRSSGQEYQVPPNMIPLACERITPEMLCLVSLSAGQIAVIAQSVPGGERNIQDIYPLTPLQEGMLFHHLYNEYHGDTYVIPMLLSFTSEQGADAFVNGLQSVIDRHDILRTGIRWEGLPEPVQVVYRQVLLPVSRVVVPEKADPVGVMKGLMAPERQMMNLGQPPLVRIHIATGQDSSRWYVLLQLHHMICDHESLDTMLAEVMAFGSGQSQNLPEPIPYRNHVAQALLHAQEHDSEAFFRRKLGDIEEPTAPFGLLNVHGNGGRTDYARRVLDQEHARRINDQARRFGVSAATLFHAAWSLVVARTSGREDVVFGTVLLGRLQGSAGAQRTLGIFINTLPLRLRLQGVTVVDLVNQTQRELLELLNHEQASLAAAQRCSGVSKHAPLFTSLLNYRHSVRNLKSEFQEAGIELIASQSWTNYPLMLSVDDRADEFILEVDCDNRIDPRRVAEYMYLAVTRLTKALEEGGDTRALALRIFPNEELQKVVNEFNDTSVSRSRAKLVHVLFEEQVRKAPMSIAVAHNESKLTYAELERRANQFSRYLRTFGVGPGRVVGIALERGFPMIVALLGTLKTGAAYVPLDPSYPNDRLRYMLEDSKPTVLLLHERQWDLFPTKPGDIVLFAERIGELEQSAPIEVGDDGSETTMSNEDPVYVIYTSGSTGRPKGVVMPHRSMVNLIEWHQEVFDASRSARVLQFASLSFDVAFQEIFSTLCMGGTLVLLEEWIRKDARALMDLLSEQRIQRLFVPPLMLQVIAEHSRTSGNTPICLQDVITAGEQLRVTPEISSFMKQLNGCRLHNHYGPTETHVVTSLTLEGDPEQWPGLPSIGRPIANTQIYLLDNTGEPSAIGVIGEIYVGGCALATEYLNQRDLTSQKFAEIDIGDASRVRLYRTGDLGRWGTDGTIEYLGRRDEQVKIRGLRIELGEIEAQLALHPTVKEAVVIVRGDRSEERRLLAYVTKVAGADMSTEGLRDHLRLTLPEYMIPSVFVVLEQLPLTPNGKLDRRALPEPELVVHGGRHEAPSGEIEEGLAEVWQELLRVEGIGRHDNFFELGGHSLHGIKLVGRVLQRFSVALSVVTLFQCPTIEQMARRIAQLQVSQEPSGKFEESGLEEEGVL